MRNDGDGRSVPGQAIMQDKNADEDDDNDCHAPEPDQYHRSSSMYSNMISLQIKDQPTVSSWLADNGWKIMLMTIMMTIMTKKNVTYTIDNNFSDEKGGLSPNC